MEGDGKIQMQSRSRMGALRIGVKGGLKAYCVLQRKHEGVSLAGSGVLLLQRGEGRRKEKRERDYGVSAVAMGRQPC